MARGLAGADFAGNLDGAARTTAAFRSGSSCPASGVGDDGEGAAAGNFVVEGSHGRKSVERGIKGRDYTRRFP